MKLLREWFALPCSGMIVEESRAKNAGKILLSGVVQRADTLNQNGRMYPKDILVREVENYQKLIRENRAVGECDHPDQSVVSLKNVSHIIRELHIDGNDVHGTIEILPTPSGKILESLVASGVQIGISSRGVGSTKKENDVDVVQEDYQIICWDCVQDPSTPQAFLHRELHESIDPHELKRFFTRSDRLDRLMNDIICLHEKNKR